MNDSVQSQVSGPATGLMVTAGLGAVFQLLGLLAHLGIMGAAFAGNAAFSGGNSGLASMMAGGLGLALRIIGLAMSVVVFMGASKMKNLQSHGFAMAAAILALIPCTSPCCCLGLPIGIWALIVLLKPEVKAAFTA